MRRFGGKTVSNILIGSRDDGAVQQPDAADEVRAGLRPRPSPLIWVLDGQGGTDVRRFASAVASLPLLLGVAVCEAQPVGKPADWLPYEVSSEMPRKVEPAALDKILSGMTLGQVVDLLGKGWLPPNSGTGTITWGCTDGRNLKVKPKRYLKDEVVSFEQREDDPARMSIERSLPGHR